MVEAVVNSEELKLSDKLAVERTVMGADRTLLAWVRTSTSMISFGFTIFKILEALQKAEPGKFIKEQTPRNIGIFMLLVGIFPLALAMYQYRQTIKRLGGKGTVYINPAMVTGTAILLLGFALLTTIVLHVELF
jgi:putative membrane protein